jgi:glucose/arabinose dehydrogenase
MRAAVSSVLALALCASSALTAQAAQAPQPPPGISVAQPAGDVCPPGGRNITDTFAPKPETADQTRAPRLKTDESAYKVDTVLTGLARPRSIVMVPDGRILVAEGRDHLRFIDKAGKMSAPLAGLPAIAAGAQTGIQDVVLDPGFARNGLIYFTYNANIPGAVSPGPNQPIPTEGKLVKAKIAGDRAEVVQILYQGGPLRRLVVLGDGTLAFTSVSADGKQSQDLATPGGKVMRVSTSGSVPRDNPYASRKDNGRFVYAIGQRDSDGLMRDGQGRLWAVEHGPRGGDELNIVHKGANLGYPKISYGIEYNGDKIAEGASAAPGLVQPVYFWTPDIGPTSLMAYTGNMFPGWKGDLFTGGLVAESLVRLHMKNGRVVGEEYLMAPRCNRVRDVKQAADGSIYVLTDSPANGQLLHLTKG